MRRVRRTSTLLSLDSGDERLDRGAIADLAERHRRPGADARLGVLQRLHERRRRPRVTELAERRDGVQPDVGLLVLQRFDQPRHRARAAHAWPSAIAACRRTPASLSLSATISPSMARLVRALLRRDAGHPHLRRQRVRRVTIRATG